uniref:F-box domain-containing protein n=1 Tax=Acrobeloides nanus TaxID=290746 RepID=A0A914EAJ8_9BILA
MSRLPTHIKIQNEFIEIKANSIENVVVEQSKYNVWNLTFIVEDQSYFGKIIFPRNYPVQAPNIQICTTPNLKEPRKLLYLPIIENWKASCTAKEVIKATLNVMKELDQHLNLFYLTPGLNGLQIDILCDILKFLDGLNIDNCSLISKSWKNVIRIYRKILPLRKIDVLVIHQEYNTNNLVVRIFYKTYPRCMERKKYDSSYFYSSMDFAGGEYEELVKIPDFYKTPGKKMNKKSSIHIPEDNHVKISALQNCIFDQIVLDFSDRVSHTRVDFRKLFDLLVDLFGKLVEICGQKIKTIRLDDGKNDNLIAYTSSLYPMIFNYVDADRLHKNVLNEINLIVSNPDCLFNIPNPPTHIELSCDKKNVDFLDWEWEDFVTGFDNLVRIFDCLIQSQRDVSRYSLLANIVDPRYRLDFCSVLVTFCEKVLSVFESTSEPGNFPSQIKIYISQGGDYDQFLQRLFDRRGNLDKKSIKQGYAKGIKFQRSDQWKITFGLTLCDREPREHAYNPSEPVEHAYKLLIKIINP